MNEAGLVLEDGWNTVGKVGGEEALYTGGKA